MIGLSDIPNIGVMPSKAFNGCDNLTDRVEALDVFPFWEAFRRQYHTDAHFVCYDAINTGTDYRCRCNKPVLPKIRFKGGDLVTTVFCFDFDNQGHLPWTDTLYADFFSNLQRAGERWPLAGQWNICYTTKNGARLVYMLKRPIPVDLAEGRIRWMVEQFNICGVKADMLADWTRVFRMPKVVRDKVPSWQAPYFDMLEQPAWRLDAESLPASEKTKTVVYGQVEDYSAPKPTPEEALELLEVLNISTGQMVKTDWVKEARRRLKGRECFDCIFNDAPLAQSGSRDQTMQAFVGQAITMLYPLEGTEPEHIYALFAPAAMQLQPDAGTPDWTDTLWDKVCRTWSREHAKNEGLRQQAEAQAAHALDMHEVILRGMQQWCDADELKSGKEIALPWMNRRLIASCGANYFVMRRDGKYDTVQLMRDQVIARIRILGMDQIIQTQQQNADGAISDVPLSKILSDHQTIIADIRSVPQIDGGFIEAMDTQFATMVLPSFRRNPKLAPIYDYNVDAWLQLLFGQNYDRGIEWIAHALAFEEGPICALSIKGDAGVGKKMLVQGLAECLEYPATATGKDLIGEYQYGLLRSPFLIINEGWPNKQVGGMHPADMFRSLVGGDPTPVNRKFLAPVQCRNPVRIIFTANNLDVVHVLTGNRDLSPQDREALAIRLLHIDVTNDAAKWLRDRGGMYFTGRPGHRWIAPDGGGTSNHVVAKHFLWLYENRGEPSGTRFLVEGSNDPTIMFEMRTQSGSAPLVIETLIAMLNNNSRREGFVVTLEGRIYCTPSEVLTYHRLTLARESASRLTQKQITQVFKGLVVSEPEGARILPERPEAGSKIWYEIDATLLQNVARRDGWTCKPLDGLVEKQVRRRKAL